MLKANKLKEEIFDKISTIVFCIIIFLVAIFVGSPIKYNFMLINVIVNLYGIIFILVRKIIFRNFRFIKNKVDILMLILVISSTLALIFKTYASLYDTIIYIFLYISIYILYIVASNLNKNIIIHYVTNTIILAAVMFVIFGIDELTLSFFRGIFDKLDLVNVQNIEQRMFSTFGYANSFAVVVAFSGLLTLDKYTKSKSRLKVIYGSMFFIQLVGLILSYSKATILIFGFVYLVYIILLKNRENRIKAILVTILNMLFTLIYLKIFTQLKRTSLIEYVWYISALIYIINILLIIILNRLEKYIIKIKNKYLFIISAVMIILAGGFIIVAINIEEPIVDFTENSTNEKLKYTIRNIENNKEYSFVFDINSNVKYDADTDTYKIKIIEENKYYDTVQTKEITFGRYDGEKEINIFLSSEASGISIEIETINPSNKNGLTINSLKINNERFILNYKFLPTNIVNKIKEINFSNKSAWERGIFIKDGFKAGFANNPITGIGGNGWLCVYQQTQTYTYYANESHCYITELLIEFGILGVISYILMIFKVICELFNIIKNKESNNIKLPFIFVILLLFIHSLIDFDMSFAYIQIIMYVSISLIFIDKEEFSKELLENRILKIFELILLILVIIVSLINIYFNSMEVIIKLNSEKINSKDKLNMVPYNRYYREEYIYSDLINKDQQSKQLRKMLKYEPYYRNTSYCENVIISIMNSEENETEKIKAINEVYKRLKSEAVTANIYINSMNMTSINYISNLLERSNEENIKEWSKKFDEIIIQNYEKYLARMLDTNSNRLSQDEIYIKYQNAKNIYDRITDKN